MNFTTQNIFLLTTEYARRTFDTTEWDGRKVQDMIIAKEVPETPMSREEVRLFVRELV